jgi:hypothetical protein
LKPETRTDNGRAPAYTSRVRKRLAIVLVVIAFVIGLAIALTLAWMVMKRSAAAPRIGNTATIIQQIQSLSELVTVKYVIEKVVILTNASTTTLGQLPNVVNIPGFEEDRLTLLAHGVAKAGVNLSKLGPTDVQASDGKIVLQLPRAHVTDVYLDEAQTQVLDRRAGMFRSFDKTLEKQARQYAWSEVNRAARLGGIEREAEERARVQLTMLLKSLGYKEVEIQTRASN